MSVQKIKGKPNRMKPLKLVYIFESYPLFYQPYIEKVLFALQDHDGVQLHKKAFKKNEGNSTDISYFKTYHTRKFFEKAEKLLGKKTGVSHVEKELMQFDVVHIQHSFLMFKFTELLKLQSADRPKLIITLRGSDTYVKPWMYKRYASFYKNIGKLVDMFVVMSEHQKKYLHRWGVPLANIAIIPISFGEKFKVLPKTPNVEKIRVVSAFRHLWEKNIDGNLRTIKALVSAGVPVQYHMYGVGPDIGQVHYLIDTYNLSEHVTFCGKIENSVLQERLPSYDFYLQLSHSESLGMSVIEAQTHGVPAVVSDAGGLPEIVLHEKTGFVVKSHEIEKAAAHIESLWKNKEQYQSYSKAAIEYSQEKFNTQKELKGLMGMYEKLVGRTEKN